ncbi:MAG: serine/threonine protein kinase [Kofleriaceae bacterium]
MTRASALEAAVRDPALADTTASDGSDNAVVDRRVSDSNRAWLGKIVDGRYRVLEVIGRGGMGVVYRVEHLRMGKIAAMKVLHRDLAQDADTVRRFESEAAAVSKLFHPHTVQVFDFGNAQGALYLIMELVRGLDLGRMLARDGAMPWARAAPVLVQICGALQEAHELGIVHRDLKPENVLITRTTGGRDYVKVLDFGLAKLDQRGKAPDRTDKQAIVGTPYFMAPEQIRGEEVDARTDLYAFGALMFELLTAQHLYTSSTAVGVLTKHLTAEPDAPSLRCPMLGIPPGVDHICRKALARNPRDRWRSAAELAAMIEEVYAETVSETTGLKSSGTRVLGTVRHAVDSVDESSDLRLRRSDIDQFELSLRRRRSVVALVTLFTVAAAIGGVAWLVTRPEPLLREEQEPNDLPSKANRIAAGVPVTGYLGKRIGATEGDKDVYVVTWPAGRRTATVTATAPPNIDINLTINDADGLHGATVDEAGLGGTEQLHRRTVVGPIVVTVAQTMAKDQRFPIENVSDRYTITVIEDTSPGETEPNNGAADATPLELNRELRGFLDTRLDVDLIKWTGDDGKVNLVVRADGLPLVWKIGDGKPRTPGAATVDLKRGDLIRLERTDRTGTGPLPGRDVSWSIVATK